MISVLRENFSELVSALGNADSLVLWSVLTLSDMLQSRITIRRFSGLEYEMTVEMPILVMMIGSLWMMKNAEYKVLKERLYE